jgi:hypothetical protein
MKTLVAVLIAFGGGGALGVAAVSTVSVVADPDNAATTSDAPIDVLDYGTRG